MKQWPFASIVAGTVALLMMASLAWPQQANQVGNVMRVKLEHAQRILEGLTSGDYELIGKNAQELSLLSLTTNWEVLQTPEYLTQSKEFQRAADALTKAAREKNIDAAALAYVDVTMKCIACHKYVRDVRRGHAEGNPSKRQSSTPSADK